MTNTRIKLPSARRVSDGLLLVVLTLIASSLLGQVAKHVYGRTMLKGFVPMFYVDYESTAPTWYSSAALGVAALLLAVIAAEGFSRRDRNRWYWASLAALVGLLSLDEIAMIHEMPIDPMRSAFGWGGVLYYAWVLPGAAAVLVTVAAYFRFWLRLPPRTRWLFLLSAATFVSGAIGVEMLSGVQADRAGEENLSYALIVTVEEMLEMLGVVVLIRALWEYIERELGGVQISFSAAMPLQEPIQLSSGDAR